MRLFWAVVLGALVAGAVAWWLARDPAPGADDPARGAERAQGRAADSRDGQVLYRWRDDAGVVQVTDVPPKGRDYAIVDVDALARRNTIQPDPKIAAEAE
ncbi:MAG: DUF4124 domain-containing protein [Luteimonas sp.]|nr:DUF4124 domain-containing protein [Luteimonas sp.]